MQELAAELALDILSGYERATAQAHLNQCPSCRAYVSSLTQVSDTMLGLVSGVEPPVGFEDRVLSRMGMASSRQPRQPQRRWFPIAVAAAVAALVFGVGGWVIGSVAMSRTTNESAAAEFRFAALHTAGDHQIGQVFTYEGAPPWMYMSVMEEPNVTSVACQLVRRDGTTVPVGSFALSGGKGSWGAELKLDPDTIVGARLVDTHGTVLATASFTGHANGH